MNRLLYTCLVLLASVLVLVACQEQAAPGEPLAERDYSDLTIAEAQLADADRKFHNGSMDFSVDVSAQDVAAADAKFWAQAAARRNAELNEALADADYRYTSGAANYAAIAHRSELAAADAKFKEGSVLYMVAGAGPPTVAQVVDRFHSAVAAGDFNRAMEYVADTAVVTLADAQQLRGADAIRGWLEVQQLIHYEADMVGDAQMAEDGVVMREAVNSDYLQLIGLAPYENNCALKVADGAIQAIDFAYASTADEAQVLNSPMITTDQLAGTLWRIPMISFLGNVQDTGESYMYLQFNPDGTARWAMSLEDVQAPVTAATDPAEHFHWVLYDGVLAMADSEAGTTSPCTAHDARMYYVMSPDGKSLEFRQLRDTCMTRSAWLMPYGEAWEAVGS